MFLLNRKCVCFECLGMTYTMQLSFCLEASFIVTAWTLLCNKKNNSPFWMGEGRWEPPACSQRPASSHPVLNLERCNWHTHSDCYCSPSTFLFERQGDTKNTQIPASFNQVLWDVHPHSQGSEKGRMDTHRRRRERKSTPRRGKCQLQMGSTKNINSSE